MATYSQTNELESILSNNPKELFPGRKYLGYYWMSDEQEPVLVDGNFNPPLSGVNPFIIESNLYAKDDVSISIEHIDGQYQIGIVKWETNDLTIVVEEKYLTHRLQGIKGGENYGKSIFARAWVPVQDPECEDMEVLQPAWRAFKGFVKVFKLNPEKEQS